MEKKNTRYPYTPYSYNIMNTYAMHTQAHTSYTQTAKTKESRVMRGSTRSPTEKKRNPSEHGSLLVLAGRTLFDSTASFHLLKIYK